MNCTTIGIDLSKTVFQLSLADRHHHIVDRHRLSRRQFSRFLATAEPARLVMEACSTAHYWSRLARQYGHQVKLLHAHYVRPYVRRNKTDSADADALLAEFGVTLPRGSKDLALRLRQACDDLPHILQGNFHSLVDDIVQLNENLEQMDRHLKMLLGNEPDGVRLQTINGIGAITATALIGRVPDIHAFKRGRAFAGWLGITPREYSSGNTRRLGGISMKGDRYLRTLLVHGARSALLAAARVHANDKPLTRLQRWALDTQQRGGHNKATVALANKMARIVWAVWTQQKTFNGDDALRFTA